jgi:hypothetical protein
MKPSDHPPPVSICVVAYGNYPHLARRCLESIRQFCERSSYRLLVGANAVGAETEAYLKSQYRAGHLDHLILSRRNLDKCPMMRRLFARVDTEFVWWFDDDAFLTRRGVLRRLVQTARRSPPTTVLWGAEYFCDYPPTPPEMPDLARFVRCAPWYRGLTPPFWAPGGKGEFNFQGRGTGDGRWVFITGGCWLARTSALQALHWPDRRLIRLNDDILLSEALRQQGWRHRRVGMAGIIMHGEPRRGEQALARPAAAPNRRPLAARSANPAPDRGVAGTRTGPSIQRRRRGRAAPVHRLRQSEG